jgi:hypothetical protein
MRLGWGPHRAKVQRSSKHQPRDTEAFHKQSTIATKVSRQINPGVIISKYGSGKLLTENGATDRVEGVPRWAFSPDRP